MNKLKKTPLTDSEFWSGFEKGAIVVHGLRFYTDKCEN